MRQVPEGRCLAGKAHSLFVSACVLACEAAERSQDSLVYCWHAGSRVSERNPLVLSTFHAWAWSHWQIWRLRAEVFRTRTEFSARCLCSREEICFTSCLGPPRRHFTRSTRLFIEQPPAANSFETMTEQEIWQAEVNVEMGKVPAVNVPTLYICIKLPWADLWKITMFYCGLLGGKKNVVKVTICASPDLFAHCACSLFLFFLRFLCFQKLPSYWFQVHFFCCLL